jgi:hypothetical protein
MAALEASVKAAKAARSRHPAGGPEAIEALEKSAAKRGPSKPSATKLPGSRDDAEKPKRVRKSA